MAKNSESSQLIAKLINDSRVKSPEMKAKQNRLLTRLSEDTNLQQPGDSQLSSKIAASTNPISAQQAMLEQAAWMKARESQSSPQPMPQAASPVL